MAKPTPVPAEPPAAKVEPVRAPSQPAAAEAEPTAEPKAPTPADADAVREDSGAEAETVASAEAAPAPAEPSAVPADAAEPAEPAAARAEAAVRPDPAAVQASTASAAASVDQGAAPAGKGPDVRPPRARPARRGGPPPAPATPSPSRPASPPAPTTPTGDARVEEREEATQPAAAAAAAAGAPTPEGDQTKPRPGSGPLGVPSDAPEALLAAEQAADARRGRTPGTPVRPPAAVPSVDAQPAPERGNRGRRARNLLRFTAPKRPEATEREVADPDATPLADFDRLTQSIESVTEALGGQPLEFYERDLPQIAAAETARRVRADVVVLLLDNGEGLMEVSGGVGLTPAERRLNVEYSRDVMRELFRAGVGLIEDTDRVRGALAGIPGSRAETLVMVPLVHERLGFGVLMAGRNRSQTGVPTEVFTDAEIEVLMGFADAAAASLRTAVLLRHLKGQLRALEEEN